MAIYGLAVWKMGHSWRLGIDENPRLIVVVGDPDLAAPTREQHLEVPLICGGHVFEGAIDAEEMAELEGGLTDLLERTPATEGARQNDYGLTFALGWSF